MTHANEETITPPDRGQKDADTFVDMMGNFQGGLITFPQPDSLRGTYDIGADSMRTEYWGDDVLIKMNLFRRKDMERHLVHAQSVNLFADSDTGALKQVIVRYKSDDDRVLSYNFNTITKLRGVSLTLFGIGTFHVRNHYFFNQKSD